MSLSVIVMPLNRHIFAQLFNPLKELIQDHTELERVKLKAEAVGMRREFDILWQAEMYRARNFPGVCLTPKELLQIVVAIPPLKGNDR